MLIALFTRTEGEPSTIASDGWRFEGFATSQATVDAFVDAVKRDMASTKAWIQRTVAYKLVDMTVDFETAGKKLGQYFEVISKPVPPDVKMESDRVCKTNEFVVKVVGDGSLSITHRATNTGIRVAHSKWNKFGVILDDPRRQQMIIASVGDDPAIEVCRMPEEDRLEEG